MANPTGSRAAAYGHRLRRMRDHGMKPPIGAHGNKKEAEPTKNAVLDCGWGRLLFGQTFDDSAELADALRAEAADRRDIALYIRDPHVLLSMAPQELFLDPSHTYRLDLATYRVSRRKPRGFFVRRLSSEADARAVNNIYAARRMVPVRPDFFWSKRDSRSIICFVAEDEMTGDVIGTVTGVDHKRAFGDPERGSSLWCLAVDPQAPQPGIGEALVRRLAEHFKARRAAYMDLSVLHDNDQAIALYEKLGFRRIPIFAVKRKNPINERLFTGPAKDEGLNPYALIIVNEARRRGIHVEVVDAEGGFFRLTYGGRSILCRESLSELTTGVAMSICDDKAVTRRVVERAGVRVPEQIEPDGREELEAFLQKHGSVVVKPARGEQGRGVAVDLTSIEEVETAIEAAKTNSDRVVVEECIEGEDLRLIVIDYRLVAAAVRRPARIVGDGRSSVSQLIGRQSRRRAAATGGESRIPVDAETERCVAEAGFTMDDVPPDGKKITVRKAANLHTGGTIHDATEHVHPRLVHAAIRAARAINIPVVGIDFVVRSPLGPDYAFIEANERPGLANHEPQPTAERFVDLLFPLSIPAAVRKVMAQELENA
jgi:GNAT-family acetyltransferase (TIGR03103 family)